MSKRKVPDPANPTQRAPWYAGFGKTVPRGANQMNPNPKLVRPWWLMAAIVGGAVGITGVLLSPTAVGPRVARASKPDGKLPSERVYLSLAGDKRIAVYDFDPNTGRLTP